MSMEIKRFNEIDLNDCFFDSLKEEEFYKLKYCSTVVYMVPRA